MGGIKFKTLEAELSAPSRALWAEAKVKAGDFTVRCPSFTGMGPDC